MKIAIMSDIHSNLEALHVCCQRAKNAGVERYVCLGDITGYGADPKATLDLLMELPGLIALRGNHDEALLSENQAGVQNSIKETTAWTRRQLSKRQLKFVTDLPYLHSEFGVTFAHASAAAPQRWDYLDRLENIKGCMRASDNNVTFIGHVHIPKVFYETPAGTLRAKLAQDGVAIPLFRHCRYVINVGSVGQPRDGIQAACFVIYDISTREITFQRVAYDHTKTARKILKANLNSTYAKRLAIGC